MSGQLKRMTTTLISRFSTEAPFRPMDIFYLNFSNGASLLGLTFTYTIVLVQFKDSECQNDHAKKAAVF